MAAEVRFHRVPTVLLTAALLATLTVALQSLDPDRIIVLGGPAAVSDAVVGALTSHARSGSVTRIQGTDRHDTAAAIADALPDKVHDADKLDGLDASAFARTGHEHDDYLATGATAADSPPHLTAHYAAPPTSRSDVANTLTVAVHDFLPTGCTVRLRVWGIGAPTSQYHHIDIADEGADGYASVEIPGEASATYPAATCTPSGMPPTVPTPAVA